mgnify:FL=1
MKKRVFSLLLALTLLLCALPLPVHAAANEITVYNLSLIHISEPTRH